MIVDIGLVLFRDNTRDYSAFGRRISEAIRDELDKSFWSKYNSSSDERPWIYDLQALLHPGFRNLNHLKEALKFTPASITREEVVECAGYTHRDLATVS